jgi:hypothetical protein
LDRAVEVFVEPLFGSPGVLGIEFKLPLAGEGNWWSLRWHVPKNWPTC